MARGRFLVWPLSCDGILGDRYRVKKPDSFKVCKIILALLSQPTISARKWSGITGGVLPSNSNQVRLKISAALCLLPQNSSRSTKTSRHLRNQSSASLFPMRRSSREEACNNPPRRCLHVLNRRPSWNVRHLPRDDASAARESLTNTSEMHRNRMKEFS